MSTTTNLDTLVINYLSQLQYDEAVQNGTLNENQLYLTPAQVLTLATVARSGSYNDLSNKPTIPTKTSELTNDSGFITGGNWLPLSGGTVTGATTFESSVTIDEATVGDLIVTGNISATNNIQANTINGVTVGSSPKFTDTITTTTTSGSGNAVTAVSASNGALTITKGTNFQPAVTYSTTDLTAGSSSLTTGQIYLVYE